MTPHTLYSKYIPDGDFWLTEPNPFAGAIEYHPNGLTGEYFHAWKAATEALTDAEAIRAAQADQLAARAQRIEVLETLLTSAEKRIEPFARCWREESAIEEAVTLDDLALAAAWIEQYDLYKAQS